jgi:hypothetical protein
VSRGKRVTEPTYFTYHNITTTTTTTSSSFH